MTRKDYVLIAETLRNDAAHLNHGKHYNDMAAWERGAFDQWNTTVLAISGALASENPRFDRSRFLAACGVWALNAFWIRRSCIINLYWGEKTMKQSITFNQFYDEFQAIRPDNFSYDGLQALYEWIEELDESCGIETELDVIALCCEFSEYDSAKDCILDTGYDCDLDDSDEEDDHEEYALAYLQDHTMVITFNTGIIIQDF
jgi:hypothetical protein